MVEFAESDLNESMQALESAMTCPLNVGGREFKVPVDLKYGRSWGELNHEWRRAS